MMSEQEILLIVIASLGSAIAWIYWAYGGK
jgi:hypothetical protein